MHTWMIFSATILITESHGSSRRNFEIMHFLKNWKKLKFHKIWVIFRTMMWRPHGSDVDCHGGRYMVYFGGTMVGDVRATWDNGIANTINHCCMGNKAVLAWDLVPHNKDFGISHPKRMLMFMHFWDVTWSL
jgi:hypothetical protein